MSSGSTKRARSKRVSPLNLPPGLIGRAWETVHRPDVLLRVGLCLLTAVAVWATTGGWVPPFAHRVGDVPRRNIVARATFQRIDEQATANARKVARSTFDCVYEHDRRKLVELQKVLKNKIFQILRAKSFEELDKKLWSEFANTLPASDSDLNTADSVIAAGISITRDSVTPPINVGNVFPITAQWQKRSEFARFKNAFKDDRELSSFGESMSRIMADFVERGLLEGLDHSMDRGNLDRIKVYATGQPQFLQTFAVEDVRIAQVAGKLEANVKKELESPELADQIFAWLLPRLPTTLTFDRELTSRQADELVKNIPAAMFPFVANETVLATAGEPLSQGSLLLLREEHEEFVSQLKPRQLLYFSLSKFGMYVAIYTVCGFYFYFRHRPLLNDIVGLAKLLFLVFATVTISWFAAPSRFELIPLLLFAMTTVIIHEQELALLLSASVAMLTTLTLGFGLTDFVLVLASMSTAVLLIQHVRSRTKLMYVGIWTAAATVATAVGVGVFAGGTPTLGFFRETAWLGACAVGASLLMTGLLPFIERFFDVQTDLSLLELGDVAHPLLQELVHRAPGTYNHSINVASIAEAAADAIGANGLLVRVGAYFHDIGKMLKPGYFVENQSGQDNRHEALLPAMSTLVIIAHVKDGADLARQHGLPDSIIEFIQQHHGTTLVEYFYNRANEQKESDPEAASVDEGSYRYPGPKPQTKESAVLMLSDAVESASRALVDPAPARIESLVEEIAMKRLLDGQFDECSLTLKELRTIQDSLIKSLTAVYHGRIKYPDQQSA